MGGALGVGNTTASAEFNIWHDPEAAAIVFESGIPILMAGLDVTHQALVLPDDVARLEALGTRTGRVFADLMRFFGIHHRERYGWPGPPVHDAVAVAVLVAPWLIERRSLRVDVETGAGLTRGRTVGDERGASGRPPNAEVLVRIDREAFLDLVVEAVARFA
jgi:inosine-uridine nucleoside N-ribohydrolase